MKRDFALLVANYTDESKKLYARNFFSTSPQVTLAEKIIENAKNMREVTMTPIIKDRLYYVLNPSDKTIWSPHISILSTINEKYTRERKIDLSKALEAFFSSVRTSISSVLFQSPISSSSSPSTEDPLLQNIVKNDFLTEYVSFLNSINLNQSNASIAYKFQRNNNTFFPVQFVFFPKNTKSDRDHEGAHIRLNHVLGDTVSLLKSPVNNLFFTSAHESFAYGEQLRKSSQSLEVLKIFFYLSLIDSVASPYYSAASLLRVVIEDKLKGGMYEQMIQDIIDQINISGSNNSEMDFSALQKYADILYPHKSFIVDLLHQNAISQLSQFLTTIPYNVKS